MSDPGVDLPQKPETTISPTSSKTDSDQLDETKPYISWKDVRGQHRGVNIHVSAKTQPEKLITALKTLLPKVDCPIKSPEPPFKVDVPFDGWYLSPSADAIHRTFGLETETAQRDSLASIKETADEMNHHPHIEIQSPPPNKAHPWILHVTCTTHRPPGLSMRDVRLAGKIDEIVELDHRHSVARYGT